MSNIHHQNGVYRYGKTSLCVEEDIQSLTVGLDALKDMEKEKRDRKVDFAVLMLSFLVFVSAWIDGLSLVDWIACMLKSDGIIGHMVELLVVGVIALSPAIYLLYTLFWSCKKK